MTQTVEITHERSRGPGLLVDPLAPHSSYAKVKSTSIEGRNILRMVHEDGDVSMVVLGEGFTVSFTVDTAS